MDRLWGLDLLYLNGAQSLCPSSCQNQQVSTSTGRSAKCWVRLWKIRVSWEILFLKTNSLSKGEMYRKSQKKAPLCWVCCRMLLNYAIFYLHTRIYLHGILVFVKILRYWTILEYANWFNRSKRNQALSRQQVHPKAFEMILHLGWLEMIGLLNFLLVFGKGWSGDPLPISIWTKLNSFEFQLKPNCGPTSLSFLSLDVTRRTDFKRMHIMTRILYCIARHPSVGLSESFWAVLIACEEIKAGFNFIHAMTCVDEEFWVSCPPSLNRSKTSMECVNSFQLMT